MGFQEAVSRLTVETVYRNRGAAESIDETRQLDGAQAKLIETSARVETATGRMEQAWVRNQRAVQLAIEQSKQYSAANDNVSRSLQAANDNAKSATQSLLDTGSAVLSTTGHIKLLALAAYTLSPTFRSIANSGLATGIAAMGPAAASAAGTIISALTPALAFIARIALPVLVVVGAWELLKTVIGQGADLLSKYGNAQRDLVSGVDDNLGKLTKFQDGNLSAEQVQRATELGARLSEAKKTISDFVGVQLDLNDAGLKMQSIWVRIVELVAAAVDKLNGMPQWAISAMLGAATGAAIGSVVPVIGTGIGAVAGGIAGLATNYTMGGGPAITNPQVTQDALAIARQRLAAGMGSQSNFSNRFGQGVNDLAGVKNKEEKEAADEAADAWDRATAAVDKHIARVTADSLAIGQTSAAQAGLRAEFQLLEAAKHADRGVTDEQIASYTTLRASMSSQQAMVSAGIKLNADDTAEFEEKVKGIREATAAYAKLRVESQIKFDRDTIGMSSEDVQIARALRDIYPDVTTALNSTEAAQMRLNARMREMADLERQAFGTFITDLAAGKSPLDALTNSLGGFANQMAKIGANKLFDAISTGDFSKVPDASGLNSLGGVGAIAGAGLNGYKSGSPLGGAVGGAAAGFAVGGPVGALIGGAVGLAGGLFGADEQRKKAEEAHKQEVQAAKDAWSRMEGQWKQWLGSATGHNIGTVQQTLQNSYQQASDYILAIAKAKDLHGGDATPAEITQTVEALQQLQTRAINEFGTTWFDRVHQMADGIGPDSPFAKAISGLKAEAEAVEGFISDAALLLGAVAAEQSRQAGQKYLLSLLDTAPALSETQQAIQQLNGKAYALNQALIDLGMSSDSAAAAIGAGVTKAMNDLRDNFTAGLQSQTNDAGGKGYINEIAAAVKERQRNLLDSAALGLDGGLADALFKAQAQNIVDGATLVGDAFDDLITKFPDLAGQIHQFTVLSEQYLDGLNKTITDYINGLKFGSLSTLSASDQLGAAKSQFDAQLVLAQAGNVDALNSITQVADLLLNQARSYYGPSTDYGSIYNAVTSALTNLPAGLAGMVNGGVVGAFVGGGMIGNGIYNQDSVIARYAAGGNIALAGGEYVNRAPSVNASTLPTLNYINSTGRVPSNDNGGTEELRQLRKDVRTLTATVAQLLSEGNAKTDNVARQVGNLRIDARQSTGEQRIRAAG
jgi:gas vesicle protein